MKQLGNLAIVAAKHPEVMMQVYNENVCVHTGSGTERKTLSCSVWDDNYIDGIIAYLNFGTTTEELRRDLLCCNESVVKASYTSVWDGNSITTPCLVNLTTKEVFEIEKSPVELRGSCEDEFVTINGSDYHVNGEDDITNEKDEYWRDAETAMFVGTDSWDRPVYKLSNGVLIKDVSPTENFEADLHYSSDNEFDGEPSFRIEKVVKLLPERVLW